jgi:hypothetical protein
MDEINHRNLMRLSATSRVATADASELSPETVAEGHQNQALPLGEMFELGIEALLNRFRHRSS